LNGRRELSSVDPDLYALRFVTFIRDRSDYAFHHSNTSSSRDIDKAAPHSVPKQRTQIRWDDENLKDRPENTMNDKFASVASNLSPQDRSMGRTGPRRIANSSSSSGGGFSRRLLFTEQSPVENITLDNTVPVQTLTTSQRSVSHRSTNNRNRSKATSESHSQQAEPNFYNHRSNFEELLAEKIHTGKKFDDNPMRLGGHKSSGAVTSQINSRSGYPIGKLLRGQDSLNVSIPLKQQRHGPTIRERKAADSTPINRSMNREVEN